MFFEEKDILMLKNIRFKDGILDASIYGHPVLVIKVEKEYFYYLVITSSYKKTHFNQFYKIYKNKTNRFKRNICYIDLKNIYKSEIKNYMPVGYLTDELYNEVMNELHYYQENIKTDKEYTRVKNLFNNNYHVNNW